MTDNEDGFLLLGIIGVAAFGYGYFTPKVQAYTPPAIVTAAADAPLAGANETPPAPTPKPPPHYYTVREGDVNYYQAALSDDDRKVGPIGGIGYRYLGKQDSLHTLQRIEGYGRVMSCATCKPIRYHDGERIAFNPASSIGGAFDDAMRGRLRVYAPPSQYQQQSPVVEEPIPAEPIDAEPLTVNLVIPEETEPA